MLVQQHRSFTVATSTSIVTVLFFVQCILRGLVAHFRLTCLPFCSRTDVHSWRWTDIMAENLFYGGNGVMFYAISRTNVLTLHTNVTRQRRKAKKSNKSEM